MHNGKVIAEVRGFRVIECKECGFRHLMPIPSKEEIRKYYEMKYYQEKKAKLLDPEKEARDERWLSLGYMDRLHVFNKHVKRKRKRLLDVGCGNGYFLRYMKNNKWEVAGLEPSPVASKHASSLGVRVLNTTLEDFANRKQDGSFDAVNLNYVLEHVTNPKDTLEICRKLLALGGMIYVAVPNDFNPLQMQVQKLININKDPWWVAIPDHINYFNFDSIENLLRNVGFTVVLSTTDFPMEVFLLMGLNYLENNEVGSKCHKKRIDFELSLTNDIRRSLYRKLSKVGIGRTCIVYGKLEE